jgi:DNA-binding NarL/FixJ family response regulator
MIEMVRVLLVDDQPLVRAGLRRILEPEHDLTVVGECDDGDQVLDAVARCQPDVVVMDVRMRRMDGAEATRQLAELPAAPPVLVLTTFDDDETVAAALRAGAAGFVLKDAPGEDIVRATTSVARGDSWLDPQVAGHVLTAYRRMLGRRPADQGGTERLTQREHDVLRLMGRGSTNAEIAEALRISQATVKGHVGHILSKLDLRDRPAAIVFAHDHGLV